MAVPLRPKGRSFPAIRKMKIDRSLSDCSQWQQLLKACECDDRYAICQNDVKCTETGGFKNDTFEISPYYWGEEEDKISKPNFKYFPDDIEIYWYKYPFRSAECNKDLSVHDLCGVFQRCIDSIA